MNADSTTPLDLDAIRARADARRDYADERPESLHVPEDYAALADESAADVPALVEEVKRLCAESQRFYENRNLWQKRAERAEAEVARLREDAETLRGWITEHEETIIETSDALDTSEAKVERQRDRLRAREEQVRRLRAEVTRLHALVADLRAARPAPVLDEDTVTEAADEYARHNMGMRVGTYGDQLRCAFEVGATWQREHAPVRPDRETLVRAIAPESVYLTEHNPELQPSNPEAFARARAQVKVADAAARRVLAGWPGESRASVQAEALRAYAADLNLHRAVEDGWEKYGDDLCGDAPGPCLFWDMTHAEQKRINDLADRLEKGTDRG